MKSYTDLNQSKKLADILPPESADMSWTNHCYGRMRSSMTISAKSIYEYKKLLKRFADSTSLDIFYPAWSLAALLSVLSKSAYFINEAGIVELSSIKATKWCVSILNCGKIENCYADNSIDACYEMIIKLHELNLL